jgi:hypothetical protein
MKAEYKLLVAALQLVSRADLTCGEISCDECNEDREAGVALARAYLAAVREETDEDDKPFK